MKCHQIRKKLSAYSDGELTSQEIILIDTHLKECRICREELNFINVLKKTIIESRKPNLSKIISEANNPSHNPDFNLWPLVKSKLNQPAKYKEDIFEKYAYKISLAGAMILYLLAPDFEPVTTTLLWFYFLYHLVVYAQKFDIKQSLIKI